MMARMKADNRAQRRALFQSMIGDLISERDELSARIAEIDAELAEYGAGAAPAAAVSAAPAREAAPKAKPAKGRPPAKAAKAAKKDAGGRPPRPGSLKAVILDVLGKSPMSPAEIAGAVQRAGYATSSKHLSRRIGVACAELIKAKTVTRRGRGQYTRA